MNGGEVIFTFKGDSKDLEEKATSIGDIIKGSLGAKAIAKGFQVIANSLDGAVSRIDTLNQFPKVMQLFGVSSEEANKSIKRIDKSVQGLPTSLSDAVAGVQDLFTVTKNLPQAEKMFKAVNDSAMVFAGGSEDASKRFIYAYKQALSAGKVQAQDFNQMNEAIPGLMSKVAESMGITQSELKEGLSKGSISIGQFNDALLELDTKGTGSMKSLESSAKTSTGGIRTSLTNLKTAITRGVGNAIQTMNEALRNNGLPDFQGMVEIAKNVVNSAFKIIAKAIGIVVPVIANVYNWFKKNKGIVIALGVVIGSLYTSFMLLKGISTIVNTIGAFRLAITTLKTTALLCGTQMSTFTAIMKLLNLSFLTNPIFLITAGIIALTATFVILWKKCDAFRNFWINAWETIKSTCSSVVQAIATFFTQTIPNAVNTLWETIKSIGSAAAQAITTFFTQTIPAAITTLLGILPQIPYYIGYAIGWIVGKLVEFTTQTIPTFIGNIVSWIAEKLVELTTQTIPTFIGNIISWVSGKLVVFTTQTIPTFIGNIIRWISSLPGKIWGVISAIPGLFFTMLNNAKNNAQNGIKNVAKTIINALTSLPGQVTNIGKNIAQGLVNGINALKGKIKKTVDNIVNGIKDGFKKALKIGSPSKVFYDYGAYTDEGYINGLDSMQPKIEKTIDGMVNLSPSLYGTTSNNFSPNVNVQVYNSMQTDPLGQVVNNIKTYSGGSKNDFNYGMGY